MFQDSHTKVTIELENSLSNQDQSEGYLQCTREHSADLCK